MGRPVAFEHSRSASGIKRGNGGEVMLLKDAPYIAGFCFGVGVTAWITVWRDLVGTATREMSLPFFGTWVVVGNLFWIAAFAVLVMYLLNCF
jgi:hypothetical protein